MDVVEMLRNKGLKKTAQRIMLINILQKKNIALAENDIRSEMGELYDRITFYRTIQTLIDATLIHRIVVDNKVVKYALGDVASESKNHSHFFCKKCHSVTCLENILAVEYHLPNGYQAEENEVLIKGVCGKCNVIA